MRRKVQSRLLTLLGLLISVQPAHAAQVSAATPATSKASLLRPLTLLKTADLDFGILAVTGSGTAMMSPATDAESTVGGVVKAGGNPHSAAFIGAAAGLSLIWVQQPTTPITLTRSGGSETMTITNFTLENGNLYLATAAGAFSFRVGGTLNVSPGQHDGLYAGTFDVTAYYF